MKSFLLCKCALVCLVAGPLLSFACTTSDDAVSDEVGAGGDNTNGETGTGGDVSGEGGAGTGGSGTGGSGTGGLGDGGTAGSNTGGSAGGPECTPAPDGLALFFNQTSFDESDGEGKAFLTPELIAGRHATVQADSYGVTVGPVGYAISLGDDVTVVRTSPTEEASAPWPATSLEFWVKTTDENASLVAFHSASSQGTSYWSAELGADGRLEVHLQKGDEDDEGPDFGASWGIFSTSALNDGAPHHVVIVHDFETTTVRIYVDGENEANGPLAEGVPPEAGDLQLAHQKMVQASGNPLVIGGNRRDHFLEAQVDEVSLYSSALGESVIEALFQAGSAGKCLE